MNNNRCQTRMTRIVLIVLACTAAALATLPAAAGAEGLAPEDQPAAVPELSPEAIDWLEPQGVSIVDLVGQVPEQYLKGAIIYYTPGYGIVRYESGQRVGNLVTIRTTIYPRYIVGDNGWTGTMFGCLGQGARIDQLGVAQPAGTARFYVDGREVTREADMYSYVPLGLIKPVLNPRQSESTNRYRYPEASNIAPAFTPQGEMIIPANLGCEIIMSRKNYRVITGVFTIDAPALTRITVLGTQQFQHHSYLGAGYRGTLNSLVNQLYAAGYPGRAESYALSIPAGTDHFFLNFQPSPADPYTQFANNPLGNADRPAGGTYRVMIPTGLSVDHVNSMGLPMNGHWQDVDQSGVNTWLPYSKSGARITAPEYFLPPGVPYHPCMSSGGCSADLLRAVYNTAAAMQIVYLKIESISTSLQRIPLRMVGSTWSATQASPADELQAAGTESAPAGAAALTRRIRLPLTFRQVAPPLADDSAGCSPVGGCGWFAPNGRMVDYIPAP